MLPHTPYSPDLAPNDYIYKYFADINEMLQEKEFVINEKMNAKIQAKFERKDKSFYKKCIEKLAERWNECITPECEHVDK